MNLKLIGFSWKIKTCRQNQIKWRNVNVIWPSGLSKCLCGNLGKCHWQMHMATEYWALKPGRLSAYLKLRMHTICKTEISADNYSAITSIGQCSIKFRPEIIWTVNFYFWIWGFCSLSSFCNNSNTFHQIRNWPPHFFFS